jgi:hypothetical protein
MSHYFNLVLHTQYKFETYTKQHTNIELYFNLQTKKTINIDFLFI